MLRIVDRYLARELLVSFLAATLILLLVTVGGTLADLLQKIALKDKIDESREFATHLESSLYGVSSKSNPAGKNRGVKRAPFVVLIGASMPSVLAEIGFLTNTNDEALLKKPEHRQKIAEALYKGISGYAETLSHFQVAKRD